MARRELVKCTICNKEELVYPSRAKKYKTCSIECRAKHSSRILSQQLNKECPICGSVFKVKPNQYQRRMCCSRSCAGKYKEKLYIGAGNPNYGKRREDCHAWRGGRRTSTHGYILLYMPEHPLSNSDGYVFEHRYVMSEYLGRLLEDCEIVHHIDNNKKNNDISNLKLMTVSEHQTLHNKCRGVRRNEIGPFIEGDRIAQLVISPVCHADGVFLVDELTESERGEGAFGHTG